MSHKEFLFIIEYERNGTRYVLPVYQCSEVRAREYASEWGERIHVEISEVKQVSQWVIRSGAVLVGEITVEE
jgi:hypothetical protein